MKNANEVKAIPARFTPKAAKLYSSITNKEESARKAAQAAYDQMNSDGMLWTDFLSPKNKESTATPELYEALKTARRGGFGAWAQKLYETPNTALSKKQIAKKNKLRTDLSRKMAADATAMRLRQDPEYKASKSTAQGGDRAPQQPTGQAKAAGSAAKVLESLQQAAKRAQEIEAPEFDVVELVNLLAKAQQIVVNH
jgi:hypothetical protein